MESWIILVMVLECFYISSSFSATREMSFSTNDDKTLKFRLCREPWCKEYSPFEIHQMFRGIFFTEEEMFEEQQMFEKSRSKYLRKQGVKDVNEIVRREGDGDACCATIKSRSRPSAMDNFKGEERFLVHLTSTDPPSYQWVQTGECETENGGKSCGICVLEYVTTHLLVYDPIKRMLLFDLFELPAYCSCKNVFS